MESILIEQSTALSKIGMSIINSLMILLEIETHAQY
jgi:hypothetical protein